MALFKIFKGSKAKLPAERREGYAYVVEDQNEFYVDVSNEKRIRIGDVIQVTTTIRQELLTPLDKVYLDTDELEFYKYISGEWKKIGLKDLENGVSGQVLKKTDSGYAFQDNDSIQEIKNNKKTQLDISETLLNNLEGYIIEFTEEAEGSGTGDMLKSIYDTENKATDIFKYVDKKITGIGKGDMLKSIYDTGNKATDIFTYADNIETELVEHTTDMRNPHQTTAEQVGAIPNVSGTKGQLLGFVNDNVVGAIDNSYSKNTRTVRFVVGTSTAGWTSADCDYLCDGTDDQVEINQAISSLPSSVGGEIKILDGTYNITNQIAINRDNVKISGNGNSTVLFVKSYQTQTAGLIQVFGNNITISELKIDGNKQASFGITVPKRSSDDYIKNIKIINNTCINFKDTGIWLKKIEESYIIGNISSDNSVYGINCDDSKNIVIAKNFCYNNSSGIDCDKSVSHMITDNFLLNNKNTGIYCSSADINGKGSIIKGNICVENVTGIQFNNGTSAPTQGTLIGENICHNNSAIGVSVSNGASTIISGNSCFRGTGQSSDYTSNQNTINITNASKCVIIGNNCSGKAPTISGGSGNIVANNIE